jgi:hypothetical protein
VTLREQSEGSLHLTIVNFVVGRAPGSPFRRGEEDKV